MKPYISEILEHNGKTHQLPIPAKYRELLDCAHALGLKDEADEDDLQRVGYKSLYVPEPDLYDSRLRVEETAAALCALSEAQVRAIGVFCAVFNLPFSRIADILAHTYPYLKEDCDNEN